MNLEPLYDLRVRTPRLELRLPTEAELVQLHGVAAHLQLRLERDEWRGAPFPVEVEDVEACLPLFGATS